METLPAFGDDTFVHNWFSEKEQNLKGRLRQVNLENNVGAVRIIGGVVVAAVSAVVTFVPATAGNLLLVVGISLIATSVARVV